MVADSNINKWQDLSNTRLLWPNAQTRYGVNRHLRLLRRLRLVRYGDNAITVVGLRRHRSFAGMPPSLSWSMIVHSQSGVQSAWWRKRTPDVNLFGRTPH